MYRSPSGYVRLHVTHECPDTSQGDHSQVGNPRPTLFCGHLQDGGVWTAARG